MFSGLGLALLIQQGCCVLFPLFLWRAQRTLILGWCRLGKNSWRREREEPRKNGPCLHSFPERFIREQLSCALVFWSIKQLLFLDWRNRLWPYLENKAIFSVKCIGAKLAQSEFDQFFIYFTFSFDKRKFGDEGLRTCLIFL